jgi:1,4-dihydroxy-2-naphthoate octaprenyltransferase
MMATVRHWISAFRLRTLPLAFSSIFMGTFLAVKDGFFDPVILLLTLLTTLFLQVLSNLANDYGDAHSGVDSEIRVGPSRTVQSGLISKAAMKKALVLFVLLSLISGLSLLLYVFLDQWRILLTFLSVGIAAIWAAIKYTVGTRPYGYAGLGDLFVLLFFGFVGVIGTYYLFARQFDALILLPALSSGLLAVGVLNVNNIRDIESDAASGKRSIPVRLGKEKAVIYHMLLLSNALAAAFVYGWSNDLPVWGFGFLILTPFFLINAKAANQLEGKALDPYLKQLAISSLLFSLLFGICINLPGWI